MTGRRVFYFSEMRCLIYAENIVTAYRNRKQAANWAEWTASNPAQAEMLADVEKLINE